MVRSVAGGSPPSLGLGHGLGLGRCRAPSSAACSVARPVKLGGPIWGLLFLLAGKYACAVGVSSSRCARGLLGSIRKVGRILAPRGQSVFDGDGHKHSPLVFDLLPLSLAFKFSVPPTCTLRLSAITIMTTFSGRWSRSCFFPTGCSAVLSYALVLVFPDRRRYRKMLACHQNIQYV